MKWRDLWPFGRTQQRIDLNSPDGEREAYSHGRAMIREMVATLKRYAVRFDAYSRHDGHARRGFGVFMYTREGSEFLESGSAVDNPQDIVRATGRFVRRMISKNNEPPTKEAVVFAIKAFAEGMGGGFAHLDVIEDDVCPVHGKDGCPEYATHKVGQA